MRGDGVIRCASRLRLSARLLVASVLAVAPAAADGQQWNDARTMALVQQASERRAQQLADSGLVDYQASAHGYLTFLAQLGEGFREPPRVVKADELALQVYWRAPNLSKQRIVGRRDTTLLPTDIAYHRDHLGIVQNNFPAIIRLGDGDEVRDVPHPLSPDGLREYEFAITDSLRITIPGRIISVHEVKVRPRDDRQPRVIGALYLDRDNGQVVRMALSFTRAAFLDRQLEDLFVVLENGLVGTRFWLPRRQEIEIRRTATWLDYPVRGIIRGRWEIGDYALNTGIPAARFVGAEIVQAPAEEIAEYRWPSRDILDSLPPDIRAVTADEIRRVQAEVRALVREQGLKRRRGTSLAARGVGDFARFNRAEGVALGAGLSGRLGSGVGMAGRARYGFDDRRGKGRIEASWERGNGSSIRAYYFDDFREAGDLAERSSIVNSIAAQEFGSDFTDPYHSRGVAMAVGILLGRTQWSLEVATERQRALDLRADPAIGRFEALLPAAQLQGVRASLRVEQPTTLGWFGLEVAGSAEARVVQTDGSAFDGCALPVGTCDATGVMRGAFNLELTRPVGELRLLSRTTGAAALGSPWLPAQELVYLGGPVTAAGFGFHSLVGDGAVSQRLELQLPVPFPAFALGRFGRSSSRATLAPHLTLAALHAVAPTATIARARPLTAGVPDPLRSRRSGLYPAAGAALIIGFDLLRFDVSQDFRGNWMFGFDIARAFWGVL
jgi:hypothetical protein